MHTHMCTHSAHTEPSLFTLSSQNITGWGLINNRNLLLTALGTGHPQLKIQCLVPEGRLPAASSCGGWDLCYQGSNPIQGAPPSPPHHFPKATSQHIILGVRIQHMNWGQGRNIHLVSSRLAGLLSRAAVGMGKHLTRETAQQGDHLSSNSRTVCKTPGVSRKFWFF